MKEGWMFQIYHCRYGEGGETAITALLSGLA